MNYTIGTKIMVWAIDSAIGYIAYSMWILASFFICIAEAKQNKIRLRVWNIPEVITDLLHRYNLLGRGISSSLLSSSLLSSSSLSSLSLTLGPRIS